ncbi:MAG: peptidase, partial [Proteobacteria bacterium]|nr:peptidase [Pseudomonadota bacterium]
VATGFHAIEFLLWGQDLAGYNYGAGNRSYQDYLVSSCAVGHCQKRRDYLLAVTNLLVSDLEEMAGLFEAKNGQVVKRWQKTRKDQVLEQIISGLASFTYGELAGERMQLGLLLGDPEEEHDCFSDLTHLSHYFNVVGIQNIYQGSYSNFHNQIMAGSSLSDFVSLINHDLNQKLSRAIKKSKQKVQLLYDRAEGLRPKGSSPMSYDMMLNPKNKEGRELVLGVVNALKGQTDLLVILSKQLGLQKLVYEGSDSLDYPSKVLTSHHTDSTLPSHQDKSK